MKILTLIRAEIEIEADSQISAENKAIDLWENVKVKLTDSTMKIEHISILDQNMYAERMFRQPQEHDMLAQQNYHRTISPVSKAIITLGVVIPLLMTLMSKPAKAAYCVQYDYNGGCLQSSDERNTIYPTYPGSNARDYSQPGIVIQRQGNDSTIYQTYPGSNTRDFGKPAYRIDRNR